MGEGNNDFNERRRMDNDAVLLLAVIGIPLMLIILIAGGAAIWNGIVKIFKVIVPNGWVILMYIYIGFICFIFGRRKGRRKK